MGLAIGLALVIGWAAPASADSLFFDDFSSGASSDWGNQRGSWRSDGGVYDASQPSNSQLTYTDVSTLTSLTDFVVEVDAQAADDGGIWLRSNLAGGDAGGVLIVIGGNTGTNNGFYWHIVNNDGVSASMAAASFSGLRASNVHLRIKVVGNTCSLFVNGDATALTTLTPSAFDSGSVGLYDYSPTSGASSPRGMTFDNFAVPAVPEPATLLLIGTGLAVVAVGRRRRRTGAHAGTRPRP